MMMRGATSSCLFILICYVAAEGENNSTNTGSSTFTDSTSLSPSNPTSVQLTSMTTIQSSAASSSMISASSSSTGSGYMTSAISSSPTGGLMSSTSASNTSLLTVTPTNLIFNETSAPDKINTSTVETMTPTLNSTTVATSSNVNQTSTVVSVTTSVMNTTRPTNVTDDVTQVSTFKPTNIATRPASSNSTTASGPTNTTLPTTVYATNTTVIVTANTTVSSRPATTVPVNVTVNVTVPVSTTALSTNVPSSSWSTLSPRNSTTQSTAQCQSTTCPPGSKCVDLYQSYTCHCPLGQYMLQSNCVTVRSFLGILHLLNVTFTPGMNEVNTKAFLETSTKIEDEMKRFFKNDLYYYKSIVWKLEKGSVMAFVDNIFSSSSNVTEESVNQNIRAGIKDCSNCSMITASDNYTSKAESLCNPNFCDANTSKCKVNNGIRVCSCLPGYYKFAASDRSCQACPSGLRLQNGACAKCPFGYGGFNCDQSYLLALVVVSCVLGGILLLLLLALMGTCLRLRSGAYSSSSGSHDYVMWPKSEMPKIPRATMHWDGNQLEMQENGSTSSLTDIHRDGGRTPEKNDDLKTFKGKQQSRYTYLCQGQENPYYVSDEKKPEYL
ncbi:protein HEG-like isoform X2 [Pristis pectinata]|uniref:protein HEG-like isoform X2 n=1 Tax=Pristis pectinata TaxID=685728 RepID=UPI00223E323A|nr:protein HEG-like isoform X2 [Pristis pectinata]